MTIVKTSIIALSLVAAGSVSAFACGNKVNASAKDQMPAASSTQASLQTSDETMAVARADRAASEAAVVTE